MTNNSQDVQHKIVAIVADVLKIDKETVTPASSFEQLGADSLDMLELVMRIEEAFDITIPEDTATEITTVEQAVRAIEKK